MTTKQLRIGSAVITRDGREGRLIATRKDREGYRTIYTIQTDDGKQYDCYYIRLATNI